MKTKQKQKKKVLQMFMYIEIKKKKLLPSRYTWEDIKVVITRKQREKNHKSYHERLRNRYEHKRTPVLRKKSRCSQFHKNWLIITF